MAIDKMTEALKTEKLFAKAMKAFELVPKEVIKVTWNGETQTNTLSCPNCGVIFGVIPAGALFQAKLPIFCCGKLMI